MHFVSNIVIRIMVTFTKKDYGHLSFLLKTMENWMLLCMLVLIFWCIVIMSMSHAYKLWHVFSHMKDASLCVIPCFTQYDIYNARLPLKHASISPSHFIYQTAKLQDHNKVLLKLKPRMTNTNEVCSIWRSADTSKYKET